MAVGGLAYMIHSFVDFVSPALAAGFLAYPLIFGALGELALTLWLLVAGVNGEQWQAQAKAAKSN
jgi:hypothetical protein